MSLRDEQFFITSYPWQNYCVDNITTLNLFGYPAFRQKISQNGIDIV